MEPARVTILVKVFERRTELARVIPRMRSSTTYVILDTDESGVSTRDTTGGRERDAYGASGHR